MLQPLEHKQAASSETFAKEPWTIVDQGKSKLKKSSAGQEEEIHKVHLHVVHDPYMLSAGTRVNDPGPNMVTCVCTAAAQPDSSPATQGCAVTPSKVVDAMVVFML